VVLLHRKPLDDRTLDSTVTVKKSIKQKTLRNHAAALAVLYTESSYTAAAVVFYYEYVETWQLLIQSIWKLIC